MSGIKENQSLSDKENQTIPQILSQMKFDEDKKLILQDQIKKIANADKVIKYLKECNQNWEQLQIQIQKEITNCKKSEQQQKIQEKSFNIQELMNIKKQLYQKIKNTLEVHQIIQYIQSKNLSKEVINNALTKQFNSIKEFQQLIENVNVENKVNMSQSFFQKNIEIHKQNTLEWNIQISELFKEFESLNKRVDQNIFQTLQQLYRQFGYPKYFEKSDDFSKSPQLHFGDLLLLCSRVRQHFSYYPRPVQLLSVLELFNHHDQKGRLAQIYTGEGKTLIIAMLAILLCKKKKQNVDIVTSSPVLAIRDAQELAKFYELFQISVAHNIHEQQEQKKNQISCYECQIIYGDPHSFQADILRHEYAESGIMLERKQGYIIVDEVDSMLIDGNSNKTILSSSNPGMLDLTKVLRLIWDEISKIENNISTDLKVIMAVGQDHYSIDLQEYIENTLNIQINEVMKAYLPKFRLNYINFIKKSWIENAIQAKFHLHEKKHYLIDNQVRIIDYQNTGVVHKDGMQWQKGLHQFLQLKHNLPITPLTISTNFLSNVGFFKRYKNTLLGLTGTLGSQITQDLLAKQYNVDFVFMPPYKKRLLKEEPGIATLSKDEWFNEILKAVQQQKSKGRAVLIINQTIDDVNKIEAHLKKHNLDSITYVDDNQEINKEIGPGTIIIATNLAGRGTDLTTNQELENNGGLHVIMSFLPRNIRIQLQGFGRTARQGKQGTAQLIVYFHQNLYIGPIKEIKTVFDSMLYYQLHSQKLNHTQLDILIFFRDLNEQQYSNEIEERMNKLLNEDKCFQKFCQIAKSQANIKTDKAAFKALEEKWGLYLEEHQDDGLNENDIEEKLNSDEAQNPKYLILQGIQKGDIKLFNKASEIAINDPYSEYYKGCQLIRSSKYEEGVQTLIQCKSLFQNKIDDELGFETISKLSKIQENTKQQVEQEQDSQQSEIKIQKENTQMPLLKFSREQETQIKPTNQNIKVEIKQIESAQEQKIKNHIKVYQKAIESIDDILNTLQSKLGEDEKFSLDWIPVIDYDEVNNPDLNQCIKDQQEVIEDGPLPKLGKLYKIKKKKGFWESLGMFFLGVVQFVVGCAICVFTCGAALPIGRVLIAEGISDIMLAVKSIWKGIPIDWGAWGQNKVIKIATALGLAGPGGIQEALQLGGTMMKSLKKVGITEVLKQIPAVTFEGLEKSGFWLTHLEKVNIENQYNTLKQISDITQNAHTQTSILNLAKQVLCEQQSLKNISQETSSELFDLVKLCIQQSCGDTVGFKNSFCQMAQKYIKLQIAKCKQDKDVVKIKDDLIEVCSRESHKRYNNVKNEIQQYNQYKEALKYELQCFSNIIVDCYQRDQEIQKLLFILELFYEKQCDQKKLKEVLTNNVIQSMLRQGFNIHNRQVQKACNQLQLSNPQSIKQFYQASIKPSLQQLCKDLNVKQYTEPIEIILFNDFFNQVKVKVEQIKNMRNNLDIQHQNMESLFEQIKVRQFVNFFDRERALAQIENYKAQLENFKKQAEQIQELQNFNHEYYLNDIVQYMKRLGLFNNNDNNFSFQHQQDLRRYMMKKQISSFLSDMIFQAFRNSFNQISILKYNRNSIITNKLFLAIEVEIIDEIKKYLYESRMQTLEKKIANQIY
ncbi:unnamed protein product [Paramecium pentaurelia]|uniref:Protein translocase subunit SecA n=1 Tax=Paramecium pentaurelia TaxID=43138 RepID=A0A8S1TUG1_9CILI|nr:unnamed protein product [Paramecium pentaurelia]